MTSIHATSMTNTTGTAPLYYQEHPDWTAQDRYALFRYLNRLLQTVGPTQSQRDHPDTRSARIQAKRTGRRDAELRELDLSRMGPVALHLIKGLLIAQGRYELALERFENLRELHTMPGLSLEDLRDDPIVLDDQPKLASVRLTEVGILL